MKRTIKIMLIEDNPEYRNVIDIAVKRSDCLILTQTEGTAERALHSLKYPKQKFPDLILLDLNLPGMSGLDALPKFQEIQPGIKIIVLTQSDREADVINAISRGASGYILKSAGIQQIKDGIQTVMEGGAWLDVNVAKYILKTMQSLPHDTGAEKLLTEREQDILRLLADGLVKKKIADHLNISQHTVKTHVRNIYEKLETPNAPAAIAKAFRLGLFSGK
jgi:DNA-binding NarL/FixJ family response regulator